MGIFDIFKKKNTDSTFPENDLEKVLMEAATDASARKAFYTKLLWNDLFVLTNGREEIQEGVKTLEKDTTVEFITFENGQIPLFTSTNRIFDKGIIKEQVPYLAMKGQDLFELSKGATFILNPYSDYGKELLPQEIESLLNGSIFDHTNEVRIEENTEIQMGQPAKYPTELVKVLTRFFKDQPSVNAAYLALISMEKSKDLHHLMIGIDVEGNMSSVASKAGPLIENLLGKDEVVDFVQIDDKGGVSEYFLNETKPFYKR